MIKTLEKQKQKTKTTTKKKEQDEVVWCTEKPSRHPQGKPAPHGERRVALDTMLKIEDAAGVNLLIGTSKFKTRKINTDKAKMYMHNSIHGVHSLTGLDLMTGMDIKS